MQTLFYFVVTVAIALADNTQVDEFTTGSRLFTGDVYSQLLAESKENILVSPFSAETILALTQSGAQGATGEEIRASLHLPDTKEKTEDAFRSVLPTVHSDYISLITANKIYVEDNYAIKEDFQRVAKEVYQAEFQNIEFGASEEAATEINKWVEEHTGDKIHDLVKADDLDASTKIVLVNALYFQGNWTLPFDPFFTNNTKFFTSAENTVDALTMYKESEEFNYYASEELDAQILEIPFQGGEATMTFVLPNEKEGIALLEQQIEKVLVAPKYTKEFVQVVLPKFKIESTINFKDVLIKLGVENAFDFMEADFSGIAGEKGELFIGQAKQKTYIDVNEIGVEAAAATEIGGWDSLPPPATKFFVADHPFVFYIKVHDIVLFEGRVLVPKYE